MTKDEYYQWVMEVYQPAEAMIRLVPRDKLNWRPRENFFSFGQVVCHLSEGLGRELECLLSGKWPYTPEQMGEMMKLENCPSCSPEEALEKLNKDKKALRDVLAGLTEQEFSSKVVTTPWGWQGKCELISYRFLEHFLNHKMQLFTYLKLIGLPVNTMTLYSGESGK
jgi:hypothetical protein